MSRKSQLIVALIVAALAGITSIGVVMAGWCWSDPVIGVRAGAGKERDLRIDVAVDTTDLGRLTGPVAIEVTAPKGVETRVKLLDNVLPEVVYLYEGITTWTTGPVPTFIKVVVPGNGTFPVQVAVTFTSAADGKSKTVLLSGTSNSNLTYTAEIKP